MSKKFIMAALAGLLSVCGIAASADDAPEALTPTKAVKILIAAVPDYNLEENLEQTESVSGLKNLGYTVNGGEFVSLSDATKVLSTSENGVDVLLLGHFTKDDQVKLVYKDGDTVTPSTITVLSSDPGYFAGYNAESFYQLDFSEMPFDGKIDVAIIGEPLPGSTVTLIVLLGAFAVYYGYARRKQQRAAVQES